MKKKKHYAEKFQSEVNHMYEMLIVTAISFLVTGLIIKFAPDEFFELFRFDFDDEDF